jgi:hypothetical protein
MPEGRYPLNSELTMGGGNLTLLGPAFNAPATILTSTSCSDDACSAIGCPTPQCPVPGCPAINNPGQFCPCNDTSDPVGACRGSPCTELATHRLLVADAALTPTGRRPLALRLSNIVLTGGKGATHGAGLSIDGARASIDGGPNSVELNGVSILDNSTQNHGAGLYVADSGTVRISDSSFRNNFGRQAGCRFQVDPGGGVTSRGGGIALFSVTDAEIRNSAILNNVSSDGGGIVSSFSGLTIVNSTIGSNGANGHGGGLLALGGTTRLQHVTIAQNTSGQNVGPTLALIKGAGLDVAGGTLNAFGNVIVDNWFGQNPAPTPTAPDCHFEGNPTVDAAGNRIRQGGLDCALLGQPGTDPLIGPLMPFTPNRPASVDIGPLQDPGSRSPAALVHPLLASSLAVDAYPTTGVPACEPEDQRHFRRPAGNQCDLGAYELNAILDPDGDGIESAVDVQPTVFSNSFSDVGLFGVTAGAITDRGGHTVTVRDGTTREVGVTVAVGSAGGSAPARISACNGAVQMSIPPGQTRTITCPRPTSCVFSGQALTLFDRGRIVSDMFAGSFSFSNDSRLQGNARSLGDGFLGQRATITGDATLRGVLSGNRAGVLGRLTERANVAAQALLARGGTGGTGTIEVPHGGARTLSPGAHGQVIVRAGATLALGSSGIYRFTSLLFEPDARLNLLGTGSQAVLAVDGNLTLGDRFRMGTGTTAPLQPGQVLFYTNGQNVLYGHDAVVVGSVEARLARVELQDRSSVTGCVGGRILIIGLDANVRAQ